MKPENPTAFPSHGSMGEVAYEGMTLRDYFAGKALKGMLASEIGEKPQNLVSEKELSIVAYRIADAMLLERSKTAKENNEKTR